MLNKSIVVLVFLVLSNVALAKISTSQITTSSFETPPKVVVDVTSSKDSLFVEGLAGGFLFSPAETNDTLYAWLINCTNTTNINIIKRTLDASSLTPKGSDVNIATTIKSSIGPVGYPGTGYIGFPTINAPNNDEISQLYFSVLEASASEETTPSTIKLTSNTDKNTNYFVSQLWWNDGYFYLIYTEITEVSKKFLEKGIFVQAIKATDGSLLFSSPLTVASISNPAGSTQATGGLNRDASKIIVVWKDYSKKITYQNEVTISDGSISSAAALVSDSKKNIYIPAGFITSTNTYGPVIGEMIQGDNSMSYSLEAFYNGTTSGSKELSFTTPSDYGGPEIMSFDYASGFVVITQYTGQSDYEFVFRTFYADGSIRSSQKTIGKSVGGINFFADANGAIWGGYCDFDTSTGYVSKAYLGKLLE